MKQTEPNLNTIFSLFLPVFFFFFTISGFFRCRYKDKTKGVRPAASKMCPGTMHICCVVFHLRSLKGDYFLRGKCQTASKSQASQSCMRVATPNWMPSDLPVLLKSCHSSALFSFAVKIFRHVGSVEEKKNIPAAVKIWLFPMHRMLIAPILGISMLLKWVEG